MLALVVPIEPSYVGNPLDKCHSGKVWSLCVSTYVWSGWSFGWKHCHKFHIYEAFHQCERMCASSYQTSDETSCYSTGRPDVRMDYQMCFECKGTIKSFATDLALKTYFLWVDVHMLSQADNMTKRFIAHADKGLCSFVRPSAVDLKSMNGWVNLLTDNTTVVTWSWGTVFSEPLVVWGWRYRLIFVLNGCHSPEKLSDLHHETSRHNDT